MTDGALGRNLITPAREAWHYSQHVFFRASSSNASRQRLYLALHGPF